jgi:hypothetical protein
MLMKKATQELPFCTAQENWSVLEEIAREGAKRMLDKGCPLEDISEITNLSREEVEGLRKG